jgi:hypothetical protein
VPSGAIIPLGPQGHTASLLHPAATVYHLGNNGCMCPIPHLLYYVCAGPCEVSPFTLDYSCILAVLPLQSWKILHLAASFEATLIMTDIPHVQCKSPQLFNNSPHNILAVNKGAPNHVNQTSVPPQCGDMHWAEMRPHVLPNGCTMPYRTGLQASQRHQVPRCSTTFHTLPTFESSSDPPFALWALYGRGPELRQHNLGRDCSTYHTEQDPMYSGNILV